MFLWAVLAACAVNAYAQTKTTSDTTTQASLTKKNQTTQAAGANQPVQGSGTVGRLTKWTGVMGNIPLIGDTTIFESKTGLVGIGTDTPTSKLTVQGMIETTLGGYKFPDGTVQTTAAASGLQKIFHDTTLTGDGTQASPLGVTVPLGLLGNAPNNSVLFVQNDGDHGLGAVMIGGNSATGVGGDGLFVRGGGSTSGIGGAGANVTGGNSTSGIGGTGIVVNGGNSASSSGGAGIFATGGSGVESGEAGVFDGNVSVTGNISKGGGSFKIDHPLDPENKYLYHSFVESPDMKNIYDGNATTDANGDATIKMPDYFEALNQDFRYQLTVIGTFAQAIVAEKMKGNQFRIKTSAPGVEVSWQVTGVRHDAYANKHRIPVEEDKSQSERGFYLHPNVFDQPEERSIEWARHPQLMQELKEQRLKSEQQLKAKKN
jgi:hypothetical protein